jgi:WD40 repeat protein
VASGSADKLIKIWDIVKGIELRTLTGHNGWVFSLAVLSDNTLASGSHDEGTIKIWDTINSEELKTLKDHTRPINSDLAVLDITLASCSFDETIWE